METGRINLGTWIKQDGDIPFLEITAELIKLNKTLTKTNELLNILVERAEDPIEDICDHQSAYVGTAGWHCPQCNKRVGVKEYGEWNRDDNIL